MNNVKKKQDADRLFYYRSLSLEERIHLPFDQFKEYCDLLVEEGNKIFHEDLLRE